MIGAITMEIGEPEIVAAMQFYLNNSVFNSELSHRKYHHAEVTAVRQRSNGRFIIEFDGRPEPQWPSVIEATTKTVTEPK